MYYVWLFFEGQLLQAEVIPPINLKIIDIHKLITSVPLTKSVWLTRFTCTETTA